MIRILIFFLLPAFCFAGGDYSKVKIKEFSKNKATADFNIEFTDNIKFDENCASLKVHLKHERFPWYSWIPFYQSAHPTSSDTQEAIAYLEESFVANRDINFGYIGGGLMPTGALCEYISKGLKIDKSDGELLVFSFYEYE